MVDSKINEIITNSKYLLNIQKDRLLDDLLEIPGSSEESRQTKDLMDALCVEFLGCHLTSLPVDDMARLNSVLYNLSYEGV